MWAALAAPHQPPSLIGAAFRFLSVYVRGTLRTDSTTAEAGKTAYNALRWLSTRGKTGPRSEVAAAAVAVWPRQRATGRRCSGYARPTATTSRLANRHAISNSI